MRMRTKAASACIAALLSTFVVLTHASRANAADAFPSRAITIILPLPPGGGADPSMRLIAQKASEDLGQPIIIDNRTGAAGNVAAMAVKRADPDGYTLFMAHIGTNAINATLFDNLPFDPIKDFEPVTELLSFPTILVVPAASPARSVADLVGLIKKNPGKLNFASQGIGSGGHIMGEMFMSAINTPIVHVPYRGAGPAIIDLLAGRVELMFAAYSGVGAHISSGALRPLAIAGERRTETLPNIATMAQEGFPDAHMDVWFGLLAPAGTPAPVIAKLNAAFVKAAQDPDVVKSLAAQSIEVRTGSPQEFAKLISSEKDRFAKILNDAKIKVAQ